MRAALVACAVLAATACGAGSSGFSERADALCARQERAIARLPAPATPLQASLLFDRRQRLRRQEVDGLRRLDAPADAEDDLAGLARQLRLQADDERYLRVGLATGDGQMAQAALNLARRAHRRARRYAHALGLRECARR
jgi:hypothetical protein